MRLRFICVKPARGRRLLNSSNSPITGPTKAQIKIIFRHPPPIPIDGIGMFYLTTSHISGIILQIPSIWMARGVFISINLIILDLLDRSRITFEEVLELLIAISKGQPPRSIQGEQDAIRIKLQSGRDENV